MSPRTGVVARWAGTPRTGRAVICGECGEAVTSGEHCGGCGQLAAEPVGMLATVLDTPSGPLLVIAERDPAATRWVPTRTVAATSEAVRMVARAATGTHAGAADQLPVAAGRSAAGRLL